MINFDIKSIAQGRPKNKVGLDIGSYSIKMVEIASSADRPTLSGAGLKRIAAPSKGTLTETIRELADESGISSKEVNISVSGPSVIVRFLTMPKMKDEELKSAIRFEAEKFIPFDMNDCVADFQILKKDEKENKFEILLAAVKKDYVEDRIKMVESAGLSVGVVDVDSFAVVNAFQKNQSAVNPDRTLALLNIGAALTNLSIMKGGLICLVRDVAIGGNDINASISKVLGMDAMAAEELKLSPAEKAQDIITCAKSVFSNLMDEIRLSCSYYENQCGRAVDEFYVSGGSAGLLGLNEVFQDAVGLKPQSWNGTQFLNIDSSRIDRKLVESAKDSFAVAVGLALR